MSKLSHECSLPEKDTSGLPKLPPNATCCQRFRRQIRKLLILNSKHYMCKALFRNRSAMLEERKRHATSRYFFVIHPLSRCNVFREALFFIAWMYTIVFGPLLIWIQNYLTVHFAVVLPIRCFLVATFFDVGYIDKTTKRIVIEPKKIIKRYLCTFFVFDVISCSIIEAVTYQLLNHGIITLTFGIQTIVFQAVVIVRTLACCVRINTLLDFFNNTLAQLGCPKTGRILLVYFVRTFLYIHISTMFMIMIPYIINWGKWPGKSWLVQANIDPAFTDPLMAYLEALIMTTCYFFGIAYKYDILILNEQVLLVIVSFSGRLYTLYLLADVLRVFGIAGISESMYERNMYILQQYIIEKDLPRNLRDRMLKFFEFKFQRRYFKEREIINTLSDNLRTELFLFSARKLIQKVDLLKKLPSATVGAIIASMKCETYSPKDVIIKLGWEINEIYFISTGTVAVMDKRGSELCHLEDGDEFGTNCLISKEQNHTILAVETTEVFIIGKNQFLAFLDPHPEAMTKFIRLARQKLTNFKELEDAVICDKVDVYSELQRGSILEGRSRKYISE